MKFGFVIDNRKCIGCHACTTACKQEHEVPVGVFRTWVKQVEKGRFPNTRRVFSVMRCNHCTDAPCVEICPTEALYIRSDGIVDFNKDRCIGCKSCMQACPYDALYIDPETRTAAKCNYCAHRTDIGLEPACVNVCPEHAIVSGDMDNPMTEIAQLLAREQVTARKTEKGTRPNLFYIDGDAATLVPTATENPGYSALSAQARGVGHFAKETEKLAYTGSDLIATALENTPATNGPARSIDLLTGGELNKLYYDAPEKGILWGWEVPTYVTTKAIAAGAFLVPFLALMLRAGDGLVWTGGLFVGVVVSFLFLVATTAFLVKDLDQPKRFVYVLLRPQWKSWLVRGGYALTIFGGLLAAVAASMAMGWGRAVMVFSTLGAVGAVVTAVYTAWLFAQAKGRDFWQSPLLPLHMLTHAFVAGGAVFSILDGAGLLRTGEFAGRVLLISLIVNVLSLLLEVTMPHPTDDARRTVEMITRGRYRWRFWGNVVLIDNLVPLCLLFFMGDVPQVAAVAGLLAIIGIYRTERIWVEAPQRVPLS